MISYSVPYIIYIYKINEGKLSKMKWVELNNQVLIKDSNGKLQLDKDKEALYAYLNECIEPKLRKFNRFEERLSYLIDNDYYSKEVIGKYSIYFISKLLYFCRYVQIFL